MKRINCKSCIFVAILSLLLTAASHAVDPPISFRGGFGLVTKSAVGESDRQFVVVATNPKEVEQAYANVGGVLFQATASPPRNQSDLPIDISWRQTGPQDADLSVRFGRQSATSRMPAWIWVIAADFADHPGTAAVTLFDRPKTADERSYNARLMSLHGQEPYWIGYHPAVDDTLVGFFLFASDAMLVAPQSVRRITTKFDNIGATFDYFSETTSRFSSARSVEASNYIVTLRENQIATGVNGS